MLSTGREFISFLFCWIVRYRPRMALCVRKKNDWRIKTVDFNWIGQQSGADGKAKCGFQLSRKQTVASFLLFSLQILFTVSTNFHCWPDDDCNLQMLQQRLRTNNQRAQFPPFSLSNCFSLTQVLCLYNFSSHIHTAGNPFYSALLPHFTS